MSQVYSDALGRWIHADACENRADHPYMYERGWGKKLSYVVGFAKDGVCDVTRRYTRSYHEALSRRTDLPGMICMYVYSVFATNNYLRTHGTKLCALQTLQKWSFLGNFRPLIVMFELNGLQQMQDCLSLGVGNLTTALDVSNMSWRVALY